jgi:hypothetical protein
VKTSRLVFPRLPLADEIAVPGRDDDQRERKTIVDIHIGQWTAGAVTGS